MQLADDRRMKNGQHVRGSVAVRWGAHESTRGKEQGLAGAGSGFGASSVQGISY